MAMPQSSEQVKKGKDGDTVEQCQKPALQLNTTDEENTRKANFAKFHISEESGKISSN